MYLWANIINYVFAWQNFFQEIVFLKAMILKLTERVDRMEKTVDIRIGTMYKSFILMFLLFSRINSYGLFITLLRSFRWKPNKIVVRFAGLKTEHFPNPGMVKNLDQRQYLSNCAPTPPLTQQV